MDVDCWNLSFKQIFSFSSLNIQKQITFHFTRGSSKVAEKNSEIIQKKNFNFKSRHAKIIRESREKLQIKSMHTHGKLFKELLKI